MLGLNVVARRFTVNQVTSASLLSPHPLLRNFYKRFFPSSGREIERWDRYHLKLLLWEAGRFCCSRKLNEPALDGLWIKVKPTGIRGALCIPCKLPPTSTWFFWNQPFEVLHADRAALHLKLSFSVPSGVKAGKPPLCFGYLRFRERGLQRKPLSSWKP